MHVSAALTSLRARASSIVASTVMVVASLAIRFGDVPSSLSTVIVMSPSARPWRSASGARELLMQLPRPAATRSVDENVDPPPPNSGDTSVSIADPVASCVIRVRPAPIGWWCMRPIGERIGPGNSVRLG